MPEHKQPYEHINDKVIAELAYRYWEERGKPFGSPETDWYRAVETFNAQRSGHIPLPKDVAP
jgi:hypothetical protein